MSFSTLKTLICMQWVSQQSLQDVGHIRRWWSIGLVGLEYGRTPKTKWRACIWAGLFETLYDALSLSRASSIWLRARIRCCLPTETCHVTVLGSERALAWRTTGIRCCRLPSSSTPSKDASSRISLRKKLPFHFPTIFVNSLPALPLAFNS